MDERHHIVVRTLSAKSSTILRKGPPKLECRGLLGLGDAGPDKSRWLGGRTGVVGSEGSPNAAVCGRKSDAMTMRWLRNELIVFDGVEGGSAQRRWANGAGPKLMRSTRP